MSYSSPVSVYNKISNAARELREAQIVTHRRNAASALSKLIGDSNIRSKLVEESSEIAKARNNTNRYELVREACRSAVNAALLSSKKTLAGKQKKTEEDIILPFKILFHADAESDAILALKRKKQQEDYDDCEPFTFESFDRYRGTNDTLKNVSNKDIKQILEFCLECLHDENACNICEASLMISLAKLCSRSDYVVAFHPRHDLLDILQTIQPRLLGNNLVAHNASKVLYNLVHTMVVSLGIQIHAFVQPCLALVLDWIRERGPSYFGDTTLSCMYNTTSEILIAYPEQCATVLSQDNFGKDLFDFARKAWNSTKGVNRDALVGYFSSHLYVCEVVGEMQGRFKGDLGDIGTASINVTRLNILCKLLLSDASLEAYATSSIAMEQDYMNKVKISSSGLHKQKKHRKTQVCVIEWVPLGRSQRRYLELCAKVLKCSQRAFLVTEEMQSIKSLSDVLNTARRNKNCQGLAPCQKNGVSSKSPFMELIAKECFGEVISALKPHSFAPDSPVPDISHSSLSLSDYNVQNFERSKSDILSKLPLVQAIRDKKVENRGVSKSKLVAYLQIVSACSEAFPKGECWTSCNKWRRMHESKNTLDCQIKYFNVCEGSDLSFIIFSLSLLLQAYGGMNGDVRVQTWVLICLLKLTEATRLWSLYCDENKDQLENLILSWQNVWDQLLHPDLRYQSYTSNAYESTLGEIVIMLLGEIVRNNLTERSLLHLSDGKPSSSPSEFVTKQQQKIWNLPFFSQASRIHTSAPFDLIIAVLNRTVLDEDESDQINEKSSIRYEDLTKAKSRRYRIAYFCIDFILDAVKKKNTTFFRKTAPFVSAAYISLFDSNSIFHMHRSIYSLQAFRSLRTTEVKKSFHGQHLCLKETDKRILWTDSFYGISFAQQVEHNELVWNKFTGNRMVPTLGYIDEPELDRLHSNTEHNFNREYTCSMSQKTIEIQKLMLDVIGAVLKERSFNEGEDDESTDFRLQSVSINDQCLALKCLLNVVTTSDCISDSKFTWYLIEEYVHNLLQKFAEESDRSCHSKEYSLLCLDILGIIRFIYGDVLFNRFFSMGTKIAKQVYDCCKIVLENLVGSTNSVLNGMGPIDKKDRTHVDDAFLGSDDDRSMSQKSRKRKLSFSSSGSDFDDLGQGRNVEKERKDLIASESPRMINNFEANDYDSKTAIIIAAMMCILSPTNSTAQFIANAIIEHSRISSMSDSSDPYDCLSCVGIFNRFYKFSTDKGNESSEVYLLSLELIRRTRESASNASPFHLSGFHACSEVFKRRIKQSKFVGLSREEINETIGTLINHSQEEMRSLNIRPMVKQAQIISATEIFMNADAEFNKEFGETFAKSFVIEALKDLNAYIRRAGINAIGAALTVFPCEAHEKISKDVLKTFPTKPFLYNENKSKKTFQQFVLSKNIKVDSDFHELERRAWNENRSALEFDKLICIGKIGCLGSGTISTHMFTHLVFISIHHTWTFRAFSMMEHLACGWKYESLEHYISEKQYDFIHHWVKGGNILSLLPLSFTSPRLVRHMMRLNLVQNELESVVGFQKIVGLSIDDYVDENASILVPCIFVVFATLFNDDSYDILVNVKKLPPNEVQKQCSLEELLREISFVCTEGDVGRLIKGHYHDIFAHVIPIRFIENEGKCLFQNTIDNLLKCISICSRNPKKLLIKRSGTIALTLIRNGSRRKHSYHEFEISLQNFFDSLLFLANEIKGNSLKTEKVENVFTETYSNVTECILCARSVMDTSHDTEIQSLAWSMIDQIIDQVMNHITSTQELGFCMTSILNIAKLYTSSVHICVAALNRLKSFISFCVSQTPIPYQISSILNTSASMMIYLHGEFITKIFRMCIEARNLTANEKYLQIDKTKEVNEDDALLFTLDEAEILDIEQYHQGMKYEMDCLSLLFDSLSMLLDPAIILSLGVHQQLGPFPIPKISPTSMQSIIKLNPKANVFALLTKLNDLNKFDQTSCDLEPSANNFIETCTRLRAQDFGMKSNGILNCHLEQVYLSALERFMLNFRKLQSKQSLSRKENDRHDLTERLKRELVLLLDPRYGINVQKEAFKCLGELNLCRQVRTFYETPVTEKAVLHNPLPNIYNAAFSLVSDLLRSECTDTAIAAKEATKALLRTKEGWRSWHDKSKSSVVVETLSPFVKDDAAETCSHLTLPDEFLSVLAKRAKVNELEIFQDKSWCWNDTLWCLQVDETLPFEIWVQCLVCAMIICCYDTSEDGKSSIIKGQSDFFSACLVLSSREHRFAATIFPGIIYDLLESDRDDDHEDCCLQKREHLIGKSHSLTNQRLSRCFSSSLRSAMDTKSNTADEMIKTLLSTLDLLRIVTEHRFYNLTFKENVNSIKGRKYSNRDGSSVNVPLEWYNESLPSSPTWRGRPYGVVLQLSGTEVVQAYLSIKEYTYALYYAELFADNQLGGSGCTFEKFEYSRTTQTNLSGFGIDENTKMECGRDDNVRKRSKMSNAISFYEMLSRCYSGLQESDSSLGLEEAVSNLKFRNPDAFAELTNDVIKPYDKFQMLTMLDRNQDMSLERSLQFCEELGRIGMHNSAMLCLNGISNYFSFKPFHASNQRKLDEIRSEESWRKLQWTVESSSESSAAASWLSSNSIISNSADGGYHAMLLKAITSLLDAEYENTKAAIDKTREAVIRDFCNGSIMALSTENLNGIMLNARSLNELDDLARVLLDEISVKSWVDKYEINQEISAFAPFGDLEKRLSLREICTKILYKKHASQGYHEFSQLLQDCVLNICDVAREHNMPNIAINAVERLKFFQKKHPAPLLDDNTPYFRLKFEESKNLHCSGDRISSVRMCKELIKHLQSHVNESHDVETLLTEAYLQCASWLVSYPIESSSSVINDLLIPGVNLAKKIHERSNTFQTSHNMARANFLLAEFTANLFENLENRMSSDEWKKLRSAAEGRRRAYEENEQIAKQLMSKLRKGNKLTKEERHQISSISHLKKEVDYDTKEQMAFERSFKSYVLQSIHSFGTALSSCSNNAQELTHIYKFISIWFKCSSGRHGKEVNETLKDLLSKIPSFHFVPLIYQIFSRVDYTNIDNISLFQSILQVLVKRICIDHPYHGLVQLIAMCNGNSSSSQNTSNINIGSGKVIAAEKLLRDIIKSGPVFVGELAESYMALIKAYISLALTDTTQLVQQKYTKNVPLSTLKISGGSRNNILKCLKGRNKYLPCVMTRPPRISPTGDYGDGDDDPEGSERIANFDSIFSITDSGIHRPKIIVCVGMKGGRYRQLVKGEDDIRQDAIMQQVFSTVNQLFRSHSSRAKDLKISTYCCVPLSPDSGILQWVENTIPIGEFLIPRRQVQSAHTRYFPGEWSQNLCRNHITHAPDELKRAAFDEICKHFSPAFRFFFLERFSHSPQQWHTARMTYTRSCAVNSFVGHVLGIGDRHLGNILIHERTGELVHIDFGYVFDQAKLLPCPETIPFRLTRDIIDGMGPLGTEGPFTDAARITTKILRENSSTLMTILTAVVADPLYKWCVNSKKLRQHQRDEKDLDEENDPSSIATKNSEEAMNHSTENDNDAALRAVGKIKQKLTGYEEGTLGEQQTVEGQVRLLINAAQDPDKLCRLFGGWSAWV